MNKWQILSEKIKDKLSGDVCAEIGLYDFDNDYVDLLAACEMMLRLIEGENLDEKFDGEAEVLRDAIAKATQ